MLRISHLDNQASSAPGRIALHYETTPTIQSDLICSARPGSRSVQNLGNKVLEDERLSLGFQDKPQL